MRALLALYAVALIGAAASAFLLTSGAVDAALEPLRLLFEGGAQ